MHSQKHSFPWLAAALLLAGTLAVPAALGHTASSHPTNACVTGARPHHPPLLPGPTVTGLLSHLANPGTLGCPPAVAPFPVGNEFGSNADACPDPFAGVTVLAGELCGPLVLPGLSADCSMAVRTPILGGTGLAVGFDTFPFDGRLRAADGERVAFVGPDEGRSTFPNPFLLPARAIAYPTNLFAGTLAPAATFDVACQVSP